jgi:hypothetical protein
MCSERRARIGDLMKVERTCKKNGEEEIIK